MIYIESKKNSEMINPSSIVFIKQDGNNVYVSFKDEFRSDSIHEYESVEKAKKALENVYNRLKY